MIDVVRTNTLKWLRNFSKCYPSLKPLYFKYTNWRIKPKSGKLYSGFQLIHKLDILSYLIYYKGKQYIWAINIDNSTRYTFSVRQVCVTLDKKRIIINSDLDVALRPITQPFAIDGKQ